jgi:hypothetical protein
MKLILGFGGGPTSLHPETHRLPAISSGVSLSRTTTGCGFSYGLYEDPETGKQYYAEMGLDPFSPLSGKYARFIEELTPMQLERLLRDDLKKDYLQKVECPQCGSETMQNMHLILKGSGLLVSLLRSEIT